MAWVDLVVVWWEGVRYNRFGGCFSLCCGLVWYSEGVRFGEDVSILIYFLGASGGSLQ